MVTAHIGRNLRRYAIGAGATATGAVAAKPAGKQAGKASVGKSDPYYDMNRRAGESIFHSRKSKIDSSRLKKSGMNESHTPGHFSKPQSYVSVKSSDGSKPNPAQMRAFAKLAHSGRRREGIEEATTVLGANKLGAKKVRKIAGKAFLKRNRKSLGTIGVAGAVTGSAIAADKVLLKKSQRFRDARSAQRGKSIKESGSRTFGKGLGRAGRYAKLKLQPDEGLGKAIGAATSKTLRSIKPGTKQIVPAAATVGAAGIIGKRAKAGAEQGQYDKRRSGTQQGYTDAYKKTYGRKEGIDEGIASKALRSVGRNIAKGAGETASRPSTQRNLRRAGHATGSGAAEGAMKHLEKPLRQINRSIRVGGASIGGGAAIGGASIGAGNVARGRKERKEGIDEARLPLLTRKRLTKVAKKFGDPRSPAVRQSAHSPNRATPSHARSDNNYPYGGRKEGMDEANVAGGIRKIAGKLQSVKSHPAAQKAQQTMRWGGRGVAALDLAVLGASGTVAGVKTVRARKNREEGLDEARAGSAVRAVGKSIQRHQDKKVVRYLNRNKSRRGANAIKVARKQATADTLLKVGTGAGATAAGIDIARRRSNRDEGLTEGRIKGSGLRKIGGYIEKGDVGLFGISTGRAITNKGRDVADDQKLNQSHLRRK